MGGGSVAALSAALAAALLQKLTTHSQTAARLRRIRRECLGLIQRDAAAFSRVISATRHEDRRAFRRTLRAAIEIPCRVYEHAQTVNAACRSERRFVKPRFQSDLKCAQALAEAAAQSARALIATNLAWLGDRTYTKQVHRRVRRVARTHVP